MAMTNVEVIDALGELVRACQSSRTAFERLATCTPGSRWKDFASRQARLRAEMSLELIDAARRRGASPALMEPPHCDSSQPSNRCSHGSFVMERAAANRAPAIRRHRQGGGQRESTSDGNGNGDEGEHAPGSASGDQAWSLPQRYVDLWEGCLTVDTDCLRSFERMGRRRLPFLIEQLLARHERQLRLAVDEAEELLARHAG